MYHTVSLTVQSTSRQGQTSNMNSIITFCIVSVILMQDGAFAQFAGITRLKTTVTSVTNDLSRYNNNLKYNLNTKLNNLKFNQMSNVNNAVNPALSDTTNAIAAAKNEGRNAEHCYEPTRQRLGDASKAAFSGLDKCVSDQLDTLKPVQQNIESHLNNGRLLLSNLDGIAISCASGNSMQAQLCVAQKLPAASQSVQSFQNTADLLKNTGNSLSSSGEINAVRCFQTSMTQLYGDVSAARIFSMNCVKEAK